MKAHRHPHCPRGLIVAVMSLLVLGAAHLQPVTAGTRVPIVLFASETCGECREVSAWLDGLIASGVRIDVRRFSADNVTSAPLRHALDLAYGVPEEQWYLLPAVFVGRTGLIRGDVIEGQLPEILRQTTSEDAAFLLHQLEVTQSASNVPRQEADDARRASCMMAVFAPLPLLGLQRWPTENRRSEVSRGGHASRSTGDSREIHPVMSGGGLRYVPMVRSSR
jgi:hypothetical protein